MFDENPLNDTNLQDEPDKRASNISAGADPGFEAIHNLELSQML